MMMFVIFSLLCTMALAMDTKDASGEFTQRPVGGSGFSSGDDVQQSQGDRSSWQPILDPTNIDVCVIKSKLPQYTPNSPFCYRDAAWVKNVYMRDPVEEEEDSKPEFEVIYNKLGQSWKVINLKANRLDMYTDYYTKVLEQIRVIVIVPKNTARFRVVSYGNYKLWLSRDEYVDAITYIQTKDNTVEYVEVASVTKSQQHRYVHFVRYQQQWSRDTFVNHATLRMGNFEKKKLLLVRRLENFGYKISKPSYRVTNRTMVIPKVGEYFGRVYFEEQLLWEINMSDPKFIKKVTTKRLESKEYHISTYMYGRFGDELYEFVGSNDIWMATHTVFWDPKSIPKKYMLKLRAKSSGRSPKKEDKMRVVAKPRSSSQGFRDSTRSSVSPGQDLYTSNAMACILEQLQERDLSTAYDPLAFSIGKLNAILKCFIDVSNRIYNHTTLQLSIINKMLILASSLSRKEYSQELTRTLTEDDTAGKLRAVSETIAAMSQRCAFLAERPSIKSARADDEKRAAEVPKARKRIQH